MDGHRVNFSYQGATHQPASSAASRAGACMPIHGAEGPFGDLVVEHRVRYLDQLTDTQKEDLLKTFGLAEASPGLRPRRWYAWHPPGRSQDDDLCDSPPRDPKKVLCEKTEGM
jgi:hypothetical protein